MPVFVPTAQVGPTRRAGRPCLPYREQGCPRVRAPLHSRVIVGPSLQSAKGLSWRFLGLVVARRQAHLTVNALSPTTNGARRFLRRTGGLPRALGMWVSFLCVSAWTGSARGIRLLGITMGYYRRFRRCTGTLCYVACASGRVAVKVGEERGE